MSIEFQLDWFSLTGLIQRNNSKASYLLVSDLVTSVKYTANQTRAWLKLSWVWELKKGNEK